MKGTSSAIRSPSWRQNLDRLHVPRKVWQRYKGPTKSDRPVWYEPIAGWTTTDSVVRRAFLIAPEKADRATLL